jgi:aldose 1-epimerase
MNVSRPSEPLAMLAEPLSLAGTGRLAVTAEILPRGASLRSLWVTDVRGRRLNVVLGHQDLASYGRLPGYLGATVGRYANRIRGGRFMLDGHRYQVERNEGPNALHGGRVGWDQRDWEVVDHSSSEVRLRLTSPDGDQGFPGAVRAEAAFRVDNDALTVTYTATTDAPTVMSIANHAYFNLDGEAAGPIDDHVLGVAADSYTPVADDLIPTGLLEEVRGTELDWRRPCRLGDRIISPQGELAAPQGLDHNFALNGAAPTATLWSPRAGVLLELTSNQPGLQVYTGQYLDDTLVGTSGATYAARAGIALEAQQFPDSPNQFAFPSSVLSPGQVFSATTRYAFSHHAGPDRTASR